MPASQPANVARMTTTSAVRVLGASSGWVLGQVAGPRRVAEVLHAGRGVIYLHLDGSCLAVLAAGAAQVPCGVRTALPEVPDLGPGDEVLVGNGSVVMGGCEVVVSTLVDATVPALDRAAARWGAAQLAALVARPVRGAALPSGALPGAALSDAVLPDAALAQLGAGDARSVHALLGLGAGLTPLGDDVLCGWLATAVALAHPALGEVRDEVGRLARTRTTTLSATLLARASRGEGVPELISLLDGIARRSLPAAQRSAELLLGVGGTSGRGLLLGTELALEVAA